MRMSMRVSSHNLKLLMGISNSKFWRWFSEKETPRWQLLTGAILLFLAQSIFSYFLLVSDQRQTNNAQLEAQIRLSAIDFQSHAANYVAAMIEQRPDLEEVRRTLMDSIVNQYSHLELAENYLSQDERYLAAEYREELQVLLETIPNINDPLELDLFWSSVSDVVESRNQFLNAFQGS